MLLFLYIKVFVTVNGSQQTQADIHLRPAFVSTSSLANRSFMVVHSGPLVHPQRYRQRKNLPFLSALTLWTGHTSLVYETHDVKGTICSKHAVVSIGSVLVFTGTLLDAFQDFTAYDNPCFPQDD